MSSLLFLAGAVALLPVAVYGLAVRRHLVSKLIALNIAASAVFVSLLAGAPPGAEEGAADPVPQALALTGIVISVSITAFALSLIRRLIDEQGRLDLPEDGGME